jgi:hypothetical protein
MKPTPDDHYDACDRFSAWLWHPIARAAVFNLQDNRANISAITGEPSPRKAA